ncbi:hypothetical protein [[Ruminococcus] lactaris]|uniref:hypothetical protein n=1 Tax=[Ruminococcus] lactaris TaxID=46228 RepID=UPI003FD89D80
MKIDCEKCVHKRVCSAKNIQDFCDAKRGIEKLEETVSDIFEFSVRCKEFREDVAVRTPFGKLQRIKKLERGVR